MLNSIEQTNEAVIVNVSNIVKHDGYSHRVETLLYALHCIRDTLQSKKLIFKFNDGEPVKLSTFDAIAKAIKTQFNIKDNLTFVVVDQIPRIAIEGVDVIYTHSQFFRHALSINNENFVLDSDAHTFGAFFGRFSIVRWLLAYYLDTNIDSIVGFQPDHTWAEFEVDGNENFFKDELDWIKHRKNKNTTLEHNANGCVSYVNCLPDYKNIWGKYHIEIVVETNTYDSGFFSEKTTKCLASGKPFILLGTSGQLKKLKDMGFKTFNPIINEDYDHEPDSMKRLELIKQEISRINDLNDKTDFFKNLYSIAGYNRDAYRQIIQQYYNSEI